MLLNEIRINQIKNDAAATLPRTVVDDGNGAPDRSSLSSLFSAYVDSSNSIFTQNGLRTGDTLYGKQDLAVDALQNAANVNTAAMSDIALKNQMVAQATADLSADDVQAAGDEGFDYKNMDPGQLVTVSDKIRLNLAKAGADVSKIGGVSDAAIEESAGNAAQAAVLKKTLESDSAAVVSAEKQEAGTAGDFTSRAGRQASGVTGFSAYSLKDLQALDETTSKAMDTAVAKAREIPEISDRAARYLVKTAAEPTIDNVYKAVFGSGEEAAGGQAVSQEALQQVSAMDGQIGGLFEEAGLPYDESAKATAASFLQNDIPLTLENINKYTALTNGTLLRGRDLVGAVMDSVASGSEPGDTLLIAGLSAADMAENAESVMNNVKPEDVSSLVSSGKALNVINLAKTAAENVETAKEERAAAGKSESDVARQKSAAAEDAAKAETKSAKQLAAEIDGYVRMNGGFSVYGGGISLARETADTREMTVASAVQTVTEARLIMTSGVNYTLLSRGINISTADIADILSTLQQQEEAFYAAILGADEADAAGGEGDLARGSAPALMAEFSGDVFSDQAIATLPGRTAVYNTANSYIGDFAAFPMAAYGRMAFDTIASGQAAGAAGAGGIAAAGPTWAGSMNASAMSSANGGAFELTGLPSTAMTKTLSEAHEIGSQTKAAYDKAGQAYETMGTEVRPDLGDSMKKAFSNVPDILEDFGLEDTASNEKAVRILGYNSIDITKENILTARTAAEEVDRTLKALKPAVVAQMIRDGKNPLNMTLVDLSSEADSQSKDGAESAEEKFSKFIWKADRTGSLSEDERESLVGIARLIYQVEKSDGACIGRLLAEGRDITLSNMLQEIRSAKKQGMNYSVDDNFGGASAVDTGKLSISQQAEKSFQTSRMKDAGKSLTPGKLSAIGEESYLAMSPDAFATALENTSVSEDAASEEAYATSIAEEVKNIAAVSTEQAYSILQQIDVPQTPAYLEAVNAMLQSTGDLYQRLFALKGEQRNIFSETNEKAEGKTIDDVLADLIHDFGEAVKAPKEMAEAQKELADLAEHAMDGMIVESGTKSVDIRGMQLLQKEIKVMGALGEKSQSYEIPVLVADQYGTVQLRIMKGEDTKGLVEMSLLSEKLGNIRAALQYREGAVTGGITAEDEDTAGKLDALKEQLAGAMGSAANTAVSLEVAVKDKVQPVNLFASLADENPAAGGAEDAEGVSVQAAGEVDADAAADDIATTRLYSLARAFIRALSEADF